MALIEQIPNPTEFVDILKDLIGEEGTGLTGASSILTSQDFSGLSGILVNALEELIGVDFPGNVEDLIKAPIEILPGILEKIPSNPDELTDSLLGGFSEFQDQFTENILGSFNRLSTGFSNIQDLTALEPSALVPLDLDAIFSQERLGMFNFLRKVKEQVEELGEGFLDFPNSHYSVETWFASYVHEFISGIGTYFGGNLTQRFEKYQLKLLNILDSAAVKQIDGLKFQVLILYNEAKDLIEEGNTEDLEKLRSGANYLQYLNNYLMMRMDMVRANLESDGVNMERFKSDMQAEFDRLTNDPLLAIGDFRRQLNHLFEDVAGGIESINLENVSDTVNEAFAALNGLIGEFNINRLRETLTAQFNTLRDFIQSINNQVVFITVDITNLFSEVRDSLRSAAGEIGTYDESGNFHFSFETVIMDFLNQLKTNINDSIKPKLEEFRDDTIAPIFGQIEEVLGPALEAVETTREELDSLLRNFLELLQGLNITEVLEGVRDKLEEMLDQLGTIEFDPVTDPVIDEIENMTDQLSQLDVSSLNELLKKALRAAVSVIKEINFQEEIVEFLMEKMDKILDIPRDAMEELASQADGILSKLDLIKPEMIIKPLADIFSPFFSAVEGLSLTRVFAPVNDWYDGLLEKIDQFDPAQLLTPLVDLYESMLSSFDNISPEQLVQPIREALDGVVSFLDEIDLSSITNQLGETFQGILDEIDSINPGTLLDPVIEMFGEIEERLEEFNPTGLLEPVDRMVDIIIDRVPSLPEGLLNGLRTTVESFFKRIDRIGPPWIFERLSGDFAGVNTLFEKLDPQQIIAVLNTPFQQLRTAYRNSGVDNPEMESIIESLNPIPALSAVSTTYQSVKTRFDDFLSQFDAGDLNSLYEGLRPKLEVLLPISGADELSFDFIKDFIEENRPSSFLSGLNTVYESLMNQFQSLDPQQVKDGLQETFDQIKDVLSQLDITDILNEVNSLFAEMKDAVRGINPDFIVEELESLTQEVRNIFAGLDPRALIDPINELYTEVKEVFAVVSPQMIFAPLEETLGRIKESILVFSPDTFEEPLRDCFNEVKDIISRIDVRIVLQPLTDRLDQVRDELEEELNKVAQAFGTMIAAIPV